MTRRPLAPEVMLFLLIPRPSLFSVSELEQETVGSSSPSFVST